MPTLQEVLAKLSQTITEHPLPNGVNGQTKSLDGMGSVSQPNGMSSDLTFGSRTIVGNIAEVEKQIGLPHGAITVAKPANAAEAEDLAERLVGDMLPPSVTAWLTATENWALTASSVGGQSPKAPALTEAERSTLTEALSSLSEILAPARTRGPELDMVITKLMAAFNVYGGDDAKIKAQMAVWTEELQEFPLYAIRKAYRWAVRSQQRLPTLASFITDVKLAIGDNVLPRKKLLIGLLNGQA